MGKKDRKSGKKLVSRKKHHFHRKLRLLIFNLILLAGLAAWSCYWAYPAYSQWQMKQAMLAARAQADQGQGRNQHQPGLAQADSLPEGDPGQLQFRLPGRLPDPEKDDGGPGRGHPGPHFDAEL
jgi:hypothetical protein